MLSSPVGLQLIKEPPSFKILSPMDLLQYLTVGSATQNTDHILKTQTLIMDRDTKKGTRLQTRKAVFADPKAVYVRHSLPDKKQELIVAIACEFHYRDRVRLRKDKNYEPFYVNSEFQFSFTKENNETILVPIINVWRKTC